MEAPFEYKEWNAIASTENPLGAMAMDNGLFRFFRRWLLQKAMSVYKWKLPKGWDLGYFLRTLYTKGICAVLYTQEFGVFPQECGYSGYNLFYRPTEILVTNPVLTGTVSRKIGVDCCLFHMCPDWGSMMDLVNYYAAQMALTAQSYSVNIFNSRLAYVFAASEQGEAESFKKAADKILSGQPYVVIDKKLFREDGSLKIEMFEQNVKQNFIAPELLLALEKLENQFMTKIGVPNAGQEKKERVVVDEVNANNTETVMLADYWLNDWKQTCNEVREMFGTEISVDWRVNPMEQKGGVENGMGNRNNNRPV